MHRLQGLRFYPMAPNSCRASTRSASRIPSTKPLMCTTEEGSVSARSGSHVVLSPVPVITLPSCALSEALYMAVGLQAGEEDVEEPESEEEQRSEDFVDPWAAQFATYGRPPA
ncbi:hypothetical protein EYF80_013142 [Liparis tanakae]|uniref:Uncharacterized protein n=1 Tax=Liparis tanakae TaxID=230148 RepID=A0A4Z2IFK1_9TELE|nr:hypothetical protein EYF80_013142 [Liparis tanakae]